MSTNTLRVVIKYLVYLSFLAPLLAFPAHFIFPFVVPKVVFFRSVVVLSGSLALAIWVYERKFSEIRRSPVTPITLAVLLYLTSLVISTIIGVDWRFSLWNNQERMLGVFTVVHYLGLFFISRYLFTTWAEWRKALGVLSTVGIVVVVIGIVQKFVPDFFYNRGAGQVVSTMGNPIYLSGFGLYLFFVNLWIGLKSGGWRRWLFWLASLFGLVAILITNIRGTSLGFIAGILTAGIIYAIFSDNRQVRKSVIVGLLLLVTLASLLFIFRGIDFIRKAPVIGRIASISLSEGTAKTRLMAWQVALEGWKERPIFGWGPNNYYYVFNKFYNPDFLKFGFQETWFDNAHNVLVNNAATQGLVGMLSYLGLFVAAIYGLRRIFYLDRSQIPLLAWGVAFLVGHFVHNLFAFEDTSSYLYLFVFLALVDTLYMGKAEIVRRDYVIVPRQVAATTIVVAIFIIFISDINVALANNLGYNARGLLLVAGQVDKARASYLATERWRSPHQGDIDWDFAGDIISVLPDVYGQNTSTARVLYDLADKGIGRYLSVHPNDVRGHLFYTDILRAGIVLFDLPLKDKVNAEFVLARQLSPNRQQVAYSELSFLAGTDDIKLAIERVGKMVVDYPYSAEGYYHLARFLLYDHQYLAVLPVLDEAINHKVYFADPVHIKFAAEAYEREGRFRDALYWWDQLYKSTGNESIKNKRDELSRLTQKPVPQTLEEFFKFKNL